MKTLSLNDRNSEIASKLPKKYVTQVFNSVLSRSLENGSLKRELSYIMSHDELMKLLSELNIEIEEVKHQVRDRNYIKKELTKKSQTQQQNRAKENSFFIGFDD